jgi:dUTP pyrophosphatase
MQPIKIKLFEGGKLPIKATEEAACYDVFVRDIEYNTNNKDKVTVYLGFATEIYKGWKGIIVPRSSQGKTYWSQLNSPGQVDADYRGEWMIKFTSIPTSNHSLIGQHYDTEFPFKIGDRVAQIYFERVNEIDFIQVEELSVTERGDGGFGSTGK